MHTKEYTIKDENKKSGKPKSVVAVLHNEAGCSLRSSSASELPRNHCQIYTSKSSSDSIVKPGKIDPLIQHCKEDLMPGVKGL